MAGTAQDLRRLLGPGKAPTASGWWTFCHKRCGDRRHRLGVNFRRRRFRCFNCGASGDLKTLLPSLGADALAALGPPDRRPAPPPATGLPWRPLPAEGVLSPLGASAARYLASRGIPRAHAVRLGLGYGTEGKWVNRVIHPIYDDRGGLAGWQGRLTWDPEKGEGQKSLFPRESDMPAGMRRLMPQDGALGMIERLEPGSPALLVEGPYDGAHAERVMPAVVLFGSVMFEAQARRLLSRRPSAIYLGLDRDKSGPQWNESAERWERDPRLAILGMLREHTEAPLYVVEYPDDFAGDWGGDEEKRPHPTETLAGLLAGARRWPAATSRP